MISCDSSLADRRWLVGCLLTALLLFAGCAGSGQLGQVPAPNGGERGALSLPAPEVLDHVIAGAMYEAEGDYMRALNEYNQALLRDSTQTELYLAIAQMYQQLGQLDSARLTVERALRSHPEELELLSIYGELAFRLKRYGEARQAFETVVRLDPTNREAIANLAAVLERLGKPLEAVALYEELRTLDPSITETLLRRMGSLLTAEREIERAIEVYRELQQIRPEAHMIPFMLGGLYLDLGDTLSADSCFAQASDQEPGELRYWELRIRLAALRGNQDEALELTRTAMNYLPDNTDYLAFAASLFLRYDRFGEAEEVMWRASELEPENPNHLLNLGFIYHERKLWDQAEEVYTRALELAPEDAQVKNNFAYLLAEAGRRYDLALALVDQALAEEPDNPSYLDTKGWVLHKLDRSEEGLRYLERALQLSPDNPEILDHVGDVYYVLGREQQARLYWTAALEKGGNADEIAPKLDR